ncbi:lipase family protein [Thalassomonas actiniarum]|uniref:lipase family protein n=1 Tax=Thalassomonas actiniarum TaxID=485447 RepID=UPI000AA28E0D|nr:lipase family protein [Thalassomonas actiniarum]
MTEHRPKCIHCIGHSLGGALAQLTAIWASERSIPAKLYTFGAPRVVLSHFSPGAALNIEHHRMVHGTDPVPYVPTWPFAHTAGEYQLASNDSARLSASAHLMENDAPGYINTVAGHQDFDSMAGRFQTMHDEPVVLHYENRHQANFSQRWQRRITNALITLLKVTGQYSAVLVQASLSVGLTFYDVLARCLDGIAQASIAAGVQLKGILGHILVFVGKAEQKIEALTVKVIRWVLELMINTLYKTAKNAIDRVF